MIIVAVDDLIRRRLRRDELDRIWTIDRREVVERTYRLEDGQLGLRDDFFDIRGWPPGEADHYGPILLAAVDRGAVVDAILDGPLLVAVAVTDVRPLGPAGDLVQLMFLHVASGYRDRGLGRELFERSMTVARSRGAAGLYVSATPSEHTVHFYLGRGCRVTADPDPDLLALEPDDIHFECRLAPSAPGHRGRGPAGCRSPVTAAGPWLPAERALPRPGRSSFDEMPGDWADCPTTAVDGACQERSSDATPDQRAITAQSASANVT